VARAEDKAMRFLILTLGTRGDLELFLTLGLALRERGHQVTIASSPFNAVAIERLGIQFLPVGDSDYATAVTALRAAGESDDLVVRTRRFYELWLRPQLNQSLVAISRVAAEFNAFISNLKIVLKRDGELIPGVSVTYDPPLQLADLPCYGPPRAQVLDLVAFNKELVDPDHEWPSRFKFTGFWTRAASESVLCDDVTRFLDAGPAPVVVTLGSMAFEEPARMLAIVCAALKRTGQRGVLVRGWSGYETIEAEGDLLVVDEAPYEMLFPRAAAIVHHGGVGAVAASLRAGRPSVLLPQVACQRAFGELLMRAELAAGSIASRDLTADALAHAIDAAIHDARYRRSTERWSKMISEERGAERAAALVEAHLETLRRV
jgi:UDP:flavonoid glycosyltransferase YjiC (YdhE family)